jgi:hypothetical protein
MTAKTDTLQVKILDAVLTNDTETWGNMKPYVKIDLNAGDSQGRNFKESKPGNIKKGGEMKPDFGGQVLEFPVKNQGYMEVSVWDDDAMDDDLVGECQI